MGELKVRPYDKIGVVRKQRLKEILTDLGEDAIQYAFRKSYAAMVSPITGKTVWMNRTGNLHDSYGSAVYIGGVLQEETIRFVDNYELGGKSNSESHATKSGRQTLIDYLHRIHPRNGQNEICIVCVAAMYYAYFLEGGFFNKNSNNPNHYKIHVISRARYYINRHYLSYIDGFYKRYRLDKPIARVISGDKEVINEVYN